MRNKFATVVFVAVGLLTVSVPLFAHHGAAVYDTATSVTVKGNVTAWLWTNPHTFLKVDAKDDSGNAVHWVIEAAAPANLANAGWTRSTFKPGDEVVVVVEPYKNQAASSPLGRFKGRIVINGQVFKP